MTRSLVYTLGRLAAVLVLCATATSRAQLLPLGPELQVNTYTTGLQFNPLIAMAADGSFVVFWCCGYVENESRRAIVARRFAADGTPAGPEFPVDEHSYSFPQSVAVEDDGEMLLAWGAGAYVCPPCTPDHIKGRRLAADGSPIGSQFVISSPPGTAYTIGADVAAPEGGGFVVVWQEPGIFARRFATDATPLGDPFPIEGTDVLDRRPSVAELPAGGFVVVWADPDASFEFSLRGLLYDADGKPVGAPFTVAASEPASPYFHDMTANAGGGFVVAWERDLPFPARGEIEARRFDVDGSPLAPAQPVNSYTTGDQSRTHVRSEADGAYTVLWDSSDAPGDPDLASVHLRRFTAGGTPLGRDFQVNSYTTGSQTDAQAAVAPNGDLIVVWSSNGSAGTDQSLDSIQLRRFRPPFFTDGVETGDPSRWSSVTP